MQSASDLDCRVSQPGFAHEYEGHLVTASPTNLDTSVICRPNSSEAANWTADMPAVVIKANAFEDSTKRYMCAVCFQTIQATVCADSMGRNAHYGCAILDLVEAAERRHRKRLARQRHKQVWESRRTRKHRYHQESRWKVSVDTAQASTATSSGSSGISPPESDTVSCWTYCAQLLHHSASVAQSLASAVLNRLSAVWKNITRHAFRVIGVESEIKDGTSKCHPPRKKQKHKSHRGAYLARWSAARRGVLVSPWSKVRAQRQAWQKAHQSDFNGLVLRTAFFLHTTLRRLLDAGRACLHCLCPVVSLSSRRL